MRRASALLLAVCGLCLPGMAAAQTAAAQGASATSSGSAQALIVPPSGIVPTADLRFGQFFQPTANGNIIVDTDGSVSASGGMVGMTGATPMGTGRGPGAFLVRGDPGRRFDVALPNQVDIAAGSATMRVFNFRSNVPASGAALNAAGSFVLIVGGRLQVRANQQVGSYRGSYTVTVTYQ